MEPHKEDVKAGIKLLAVITILLLALTLSLAHADNHRPELPERRQYAQY